MLTRVMTLGVFALSGFFVWRQPRARGTPAVALAKLEAAITAGEVTPRTRSQSEEIGPGIEIVSKDVPIGNGSPRAG